MTKQEFKKRFKYDLTVLNDWFIQRSSLYYSFQQKREYQANQQALEKQS